MNTTSVAADEPSPAPTHKRRTFLFEASRLASAHVITAAMVIGIGIATARIWGADARGKIEIAMAAPGLLSILFDLGLGRAMPYMIGKKLAPMDRLISTTLIMWIVVSVVGCGLVAAYWNTHWMTPVPLLWAALAMAYLPLRLFCGIVIGFCVGVQRLGLISAIMWIRDPLALVLLLSLAAIPAFRQPEDAWIRLLAINSSFVVTMIVGIWAFRQHTKITLTVDRALLGEMTHRSITFGLGPLFLELLQSTPSMLLTVSLFVVPPGDIANYTVGASLAMLLMQLGYVAGSVLMSRAVHAEDQEAHSRKTLRLLRVGVAGAACAGLGIAVVGHVLIPLVYGDGFHKAAWVTTILVPGAVAFFALHTLCTDMIAKGRAMTVAAVVGPALAINITVCASYSIPTYGIWGAAVTTASSYIVAAMAMTVVYLRITKVPVREALVPRIEDFPIQQVINRVRRGI